MPQIANALAEKFVPLEPTFDCIICCGPLTHNCDWSTDEGHAIAQGDMASIIASLENIVCRVIYLPSETDPTSSFSKQLHLTPNSVNIHARRLALRESLFVMGFTETSIDLSATVATNRDDRDRSAESDDDLDGFEVQSGNSSIETIENIILEGRERTLPCAESTSPSLSAANGIFVLKYKFAHTLNHFLFHMPESLEAAGINCIVIPPSESTVGEGLKLPATFGSFSIVQPGSLRNEGKYSTIRLELVEGSWNVVSVENF